MDNLPIMHHASAPVRAQGSALRALGSFYIQGLGESVVDHGWSTDDQPPYRTLGHSVFEIVSGRCEVWLGGSWWELRPGAIYTIPGHQLINRRTSGMRHRVINFTLENFSTDRQLGNCKKVLSASCESHLPWATALAEVSSLSREALALPQYLVAATRLESLLLGVTGALLEHCGHGENLVDEVIFSALVWLDRHYLRMPTLGELARAVKRSPSYIHARFTAACGCSPTAYAEQRRLSDAQYLLTTTLMPINHIAQRCGYQDPLHFSRVVHRQLGSSPTTIRRRGQ